MTDLRELGSRVTVATDSAKGFHEAMVNLQKQMAAEHEAMGSPAGVAIVITVHGDGRRVSGEIRAVTPLG